MLFKIGYWPNVVDCTSKYQLMGLGKCCTKSDENCIHMAEHTRINHITNRAPFALDCDETYPSTATSATRVRLAITACVRKIKAIRRYIQMMASAVQLAHGVVLVSA